MKRLKQSIIERIRNNNLLKLEIMSQGVTISNSTLDRFLKNQADGMLTRLSYLEIIRDYLKLQSINDVVEDVPESEVSQLRIRKYNVTENEKI